MLQRGRQQEALKARMSTVSSPALSPEFLASLSGLPQARITHESLWSRLRRSRTARFGFAILGVSVTVVVVAYGVGGVREQIGDKRRSSVANDDAFVAKVSDDAEFASESLDVRLQRSQFGALKSSSFDIRHAGLRDMHAVGNLALVDVLRLAHIGELVGSNLGLHILAGVFDTLLINEPRTRNVGADVLPVPSHSQTSYS